MIKMDCEKYNLMELCEMYIRVIATNPCNDLFRMEIHRCISEKTGIEYNKLKEILHYLDEKNDFPMKEEYTKEEIKRYAKKLFDAIVEFKKEEVKNDGDAMEFLKSIGMTIDDWEIEWRAKMLGIEG